MVRRDDNNREKVIRKIILNTRVITVLIKCTLVREGAFIDDNGNIINFNDKLLLIIMVVIMVRIIMILIDNTTNELWPKRESRNLLLSNSWRAAVALFKKGLFF